MYRPLQGITFLTKALAWSLAETMIAATALDGDDVVVSQISLLESYPFSSFEKRIAVVLIASDTVWPIIMDPSFRQVIYGLRFVSISVLKKSVDTLFSFFF